MKTCIVGAGALGGLLGARLALAGARPTLVDRGPRAATLRRDGLRLVEADGSVRVTRAFRTAESCLRAGAHDLVLLCVKAYDLPDLAPELPALIGPDTVVLTLQNGLPWWYFERHGGPLEGTRLRSVDPTGELASRIDPGCIAGGVAYPAAEIDASGAVRHVEGDRFAVGELDGRITGRIETLANHLAIGGFRVRPIEDIRAELWLKALGSVSFNPISAITGATMAGICRCPESRALVRRMMEEAEGVATRLGISLRRTIDERMAGAEAVGEHRTSMLQDLEAGRRLETGALVESVRELGQLVDRPTPTIDAVAACLALTVAVHQEGGEADRGSAYRRRVRRVS